MPKEYVNNSPAIRFIDRGDHLMRLQGRVVKPMLAEMTSEHEKIKNTAISAQTNAKQFVRETMDRMKKSRERWEDVDLMFHLFFCRFVDNFQIFLEELIADVARHNPQLVEGIRLRKADETLAPDQKLEKRLRKLSFMSLSELEETLADLMDFALFETPDSAARVAHLYDVRNLVIHNYGVVDRHFLTRYPDCTVAPGTTLRLSDDFIHQSFDELIKASGSIQMRTTEKFGLTYQTTVQGEIEWWEK